MPRSYDILGSILQGQNIGANFMAPIVAGNRRREQEALNAEKLKQLLKQQAFENALAQQREDRSQQEFETRMQASKSAAESRPTRNQAQMELFRKSLMEQLQGLSSGKSDVLFPAGVATTPEGEFRPDVLDQQQKLQETALKLRSFKEEQDRRKGQESARFKTGQDIRKQKAAGIAKGKEAATAFARQKEIEGLKQAGRSALEKEKFERAAPFKVEIEGLKAKQRERLEAAKTKGRIQVQEAKPKKAPKAQRVFDGKDVVFKVWDAETGKYKEVARGPRSLVAGIKTKAKVLGKIAAMIADDKSDELTDGQKYLYFFAPTNATKSKVQGKVIEAQNVLTRLVDLEQKFDPQLLTYASGAQGFLAHGLDKVLGKGNVDAKLKEWQGRRAAYRSLADAESIVWKKWATGVAARPEEESKIAKSFPNFEADSPTEYIEKLRARIGVVKRELERLTNLNYPGFLPPNALNSTGANLNKYMTE